jgi:hypothetical protein
MDWLRRFVRGEEKDLLPGIKGNGMGDKSLRGFVQECCLPEPTVAQQKQQQRDVWGAHRDRLCRLLDHAWLQRAAS